MELPLKVDTSTPSEMDQMSSLCPSLSVAGKVIKSELTKLLEPLKAKEQYPQDWCKSVFVRFTRKVIGSHIKIIKEFVANIPYNVLMGITLRLVPSTRERFARENQASFRPGSAIDLRR